VARSSAGESTLHRHMRVLSAFSPLQPFLTLSELARRTTMAPSTLHRLLGDLQHEALVERMPDRTYRLGLRLWELAAHTPGAPGLREVARSWLAAAHTRIGQHTQLGVLAGVDVLFIDRLSHPDGVVNTVLIGGRLPLHASSSGLVLLAHAPQATLDDVLAAGLHAYTPHTIRTRGQLEAALQRTRTDGYALSDGHIHEESRGVAVPVRGPDSSVYAALGAVVPNDGSSPLPVVEVLAIAAKGIEQALRDAYSANPSKPERQPLPGVSARSWDYMTLLRHRERQSGATTSPAEADVR